MFANVFNDFIISYKSNKTNGKALLYLKEILTEEEFAMMRDKVMSELHLEKEKTEIDVTAERLNKLKNMI
mgnify:CR=1 FL=1